MDFNSLFEYRPDTGELFNKRTGRPAGGVNTGGYLQVEIKGKKYMVHRVIWDMSNPSDTLSDHDEIDHIDHDPKNNRIDNLRKVSPGENRKNKSRYKSNKSGTAGVHFENRRGKWVAKIRLSGRNRHIGYFDSLEAAVAARADAERANGFHTNHGAINS
jgi:hypothetical protein